jgi:hypothetical protein
MHRGQGSITTHDRAPVRDRRRALGRHVSLAMAVAASSALLLAAGADAAPKAGKWKGDWYTSSGKAYGNKPVLFTVEKKRKKLTVKKFRSKSLPIYCPGSFFTWDFTEIKVPKATIRDGAVDHLHPIKIQGTKYGEMELKGSFKRKKASGTLRYQDPSCYGTTAWKAKLRN